MEITNVLIQVGTSNVQRLVDFYRDVVQLPPHPSPNMGPQNFVLGTSATFSIQEHSLVSGANKDPGRVIIDLWVNDIEAEHARLEAQGVPFSRSMGREHWGAIISTFSDPDGNTIQLFQDRPAIRTVPAPPAT
jgi:predicted enzyme related to lactoylglutathione lyase